MKTTDGKTEDRRPEAEGLEDAAWAAELAAMNSAATIPHGYRLVPVAVLREAMQLVDAHGVGAVGSLSRQCKRVAGELEALVKAQGAADGRSKMADGALDEEPTMLEPLIEPAVAMIRDDHTLFFAELVSFVGTVAVRTGWPALKPKLEQLGDCANEMECRHTQRQVGTYLPFVIACMDGHQARCIEMLTAELEKTDAISTEHGKRNTENEGILAA